MKVSWIAAIVTSVLIAGPAIAQTGQVPSGDAALGSVRLPRTVMADGKALNAGTYQVRLTGQAAMPAVPGQQMERWVEFVQGGAVAGREVVSIVPAAEMSELQPGPPGAAQTSTGTRVEMLKGDEYLSVWIHRGGVNYLIHMPPAQ